jgi:nitroreductase
MDVRDAILGRRSIRRYADKPIPDSAVAGLIEAVRWAPSSGNLQARKFYFVFNKDTKARLAVLALNQMFIATAPLVVVACADYEKIAGYGNRGKTLYVIQDVACAAENILLEAYELGLGSVWVGAFDASGVANALNLPENLMPMAIIPVGYGAHHPKAPEREAKEAIVTILR